MAVFVVTTTEDENDAGATVADPGGDGLSLREALRIANGTTVADRITFDADVFRPGRPVAERTIVLTEGELAITRSVEIDGNLDDDRRPDVVIDADGDSRVLNLEGPEGGPSIDVELDGLVVTGGRLTVDSLAGRGGGIIAYRAAVTLEDSVLSGNTTGGSGADGGGLYAFRGSPVTLIRSEVTGNTITGNGSPGGGISAVIDSPVLAIDTTISGNEVANTSRGPGGGIFTTVRSPVTLIDTIVSDNVTRGRESDGGAVRTGQESPITAINSTIVGNGTFGVDSPGGAFSGYLNCPVIVINSTITGNLSAAADGSGGGIFGDDKRARESKVVVENSIVAGNDAASNPDIEAPAELARGGAPFESNGANLFSSREGFAPEASDLVLTPGRLDEVFAAVGANPTTGIRTGRLADNGGPTETVALRDNASNPALDAGVNAHAVDRDGDRLRFDQRGDGFERIVGDGVDLGAFEVQSSVPPQALFTEGADRRDLNNFDLGAFDNTTNALGGNDVVRLSATQNLGVAFRGGAGNDEITGSPSGDVVYGDGGDDLLKGGGGNDRLDGAVGADRLLGGGGGDSLLGQGGDDLLDGASGNDTLRGGAASDRFVVQGRSFGEDRIADFTAGTDVLRLQDVGLRGGGAVDAFSDLDTSGNGRLDPADAAVVGTSGGLQLLLAGGSVSLAGLSYLAADDVLIG